MPDEWLEDTEEKTSQNSLTPTHNIYNSSSNQAENASTITSKQKAKNSPEKPLQEKNAPPSFPEPSARIDALIAEILRYDLNFNKALFVKAFKIAKHQHKGQFRSSGEEYIHHPISVVEILASKKMDADSLITGLLHDTVEDTNLTLEDIKNEFGETIMKLVDSVTKLGHLKHVTQISNQAENFRKLILATARDIRVLVIKLADRMHNMRTLHYIKKPEKKLRIARETLEIFAPLADRLGIHDWTKELEDLCFCEINPNARTSIIKRLEFLSATGDLQIIDTQETIKNLLHKNNIEAIIRGRRKTPYSIWKKMQTKNIGFDQLSDIIAFRVIVDNLSQCYLTLGIMHQTYAVVPGRFKDYISLAKPNGYQSIHTVLIGPNSIRIELQIRTKEMNDIAEMGMAAHWLYKQRDGRISRDGSNFKWLRQLLEILENTSGVDEFLEHTKLEMFGDRVFAFSPKGELFSLPRGATLIDFAYAVHSDIGDRCVTARVNGHITPLRATLRNGDQVEIVTNSNAMPKKSWEHIVITGKAKTYINRSLRLQKRKQSRDLGEKILKTTFQELKQEFSAPELDNYITSVPLYDDLEDLYVAIGEARASAVKILHILHPSTIHHKGTLHHKNAILPKDNSANSAASLNDKNGGSLSHKVKINGREGDVVIRYARCCFPLPGEAISAIATTGSGITVHCSNCRDLDKFSDMQERWLDVEWAQQQPHDYYISRILVTIINTPGSLADITATIGQAKSNIEDMKFLRRHSDFYEIQIDIMVKKLDQLNNIITKLKATSVVHDCIRVQS